MKYEDLTKKIIRAFYNVYNSLGYGFLEKVYERSMLLELLEMGLKVENQKRVSVFYRERLVGDYFSDLIIEDLVICELKAQEALSLADECQLLNYLKATEIEVGLLFNFGKKPEFRRKLFENIKKQNVIKSLSAGRQADNPSDPSNPSNPCSIPVPPNK